MLWNIRASSALNSRKVGTSSSACRVSSALKQDVILCLLAFFLVRSASVSSINIKLCISQKQQNFIMFIIVLGRHVSILTESSSGPSKIQILT